MAHLQCIVAKKLPHNFHNNHYLGVVMSSPCKISTCRGLKYSR